MQLSTSSLSSDAAANPLPIDLAATRGRNPSTGSSKDASPDFGDLLNGQASTEQPANADKPARSAKPVAEEDDEFAESGEIAGEPIDSTDETTASSIAWLMANGFILPPQTPSLPTAPTALCSPTPGAVEDGAEVLSTDEMAPTAEFSEAAPSMARAQTAPSSTPASVDTVFGAMERVAGRSAANGDSETAEQTPAAMFPRATTASGAEHPRQATSDMPFASDSPRESAANQIALETTATSEMPAGWGQEFSTTAPAENSAVAATRAAELPEAMARLGMSRYTDAAASAEVAATTESGAGAESSSVAGELKATGLRRAASPGSFALVDVQSDSTSQAEKFAAGSDRAGKVADVLEKLGIKKSLTSNGELVAKHDELVGTNVAKSRSAMSTFAAHAELSSSLDATSAYAVTSTDVVASASAMTPAEATPETASAARRSVDSVLAVVDHFRTTGGQHGVNLKFNVGGVDLAVRVEIRGDQVQTVFHTDSAELRSALASEWHSVAADASDRTQRVAEPVFTSSSGGQANSGGSAGSEQRGAHTRQDGTAFDDLVASRSALRRATAFATSSVAETAPATAAPVARPGRLHVLA